MKVLKYSIGQERRPNIEKGKYDESIFLDQYQQALRLINDFLSDKEDQSLKCVAFCGDRGEGKTSCMASVKEILSSFTNERSDAHRLIESLGCENIKTSKPVITEIIDPSFFDDTHNVLEIIIGSLYNSYRQSDKKDKADLKNNLLKAFQSVRRTLSAMKEDEWSGLNDLHKLTELAANITLKQQMADLVAAYLKFMEADYLVVSIDDIDLDITYAYKMCEQIRKYLSVPSCIVMMAFKVAQLQNVVAQALKCSIGESGGKFAFFPDERIVDMAKKYLNKFIPTTGRVEMPKAYSMADIAIEFPGEDNKIVHLKNIKESIVQMIFGRTRYLFYNPFDGVSPIVPNNLRDLITLIGLLLTMPPIKDSRNKDSKSQLQANKEHFKYFFYTVWKNRFPEDIHRRLNALLDIDFGTSFNREVISLLWYKFKPILSKDYDLLEENETPPEDAGDKPSEDGLQEFESLVVKAGLMAHPVKVAGFGGKSLQQPSELMIQSICSDKVFGYNLTIGDVFYLFSLLECETLSDNDFALVFFLKSLYSIKLYESYDSITEEIKKVFPAEDDETKGLSIIDHRFDNSNKLQQLIGGSYFTYCPGDLLSKEDGISGYDMRIINSEVLHELIDELKEDYCLLEDNPDWKDSFYNKLNVLEFFVLTIKCAVYNKSFIPGDRNEVVWALQNLRKNFEPFQYKPFSKNTAYYIFDITAPFGNLVNVEYAYRRFEGIDEDFYKFILMSDQSLLNKIMKAAAEDRKYIHHPESSEWEQMHRLLSDCVIRNAEVLSSIKNNMAVHRKRSHDSNREDFFSFYDQLRKSGMKTQRTSPDSSPDEITFNFLEPLHDLLQSIKKAEDEEEDVIGMDEIDEETVRRLEKRYYFSCIFDSRIRRKSSTVKKNQVPTLEEVKLTIGKSKVPKKIRKKLASHPYFSSWEEQGLKGLFPDREDGKAYSPDELTAYLKRCGEILRNNTNHETLSDPPTYQESDDTDLIGVSEPETEYKVTQMIEPPLDGKKTR